MTQAHPLQWPISRPRTKTPIRATFGKRVTRPGRTLASSESLTVADALGRLQREVDLLGAKNYVLSSNVQVRLDGLPRSGQPEPTDKGVALYFTLAGKPHCLPCDRYDRVADNIAAIAKHIEATRAIERYGVASLSEMFTGFLALPEPGRRTWREVFGFGPTEPISAAYLKDRYRAKSRYLHPDSPGGSTEAFNELTRARDEGLDAIGASKR